ncbi:zona pellucida sperm-binding protein 3-like [Micropterus salmoides]|uniref:zona pellucida sperm-binding protein 3-like n=1 Tax=Micropterus salmoides TaxID=27706 RepID=UPI0018ED016C|nr:zona pellucida sperm-binding protein 3-like [Micropterus salmoides]
MDSFESRSEDGLFLEDPELVWARMETMMSKEMTPAPAPETKLLRSASGSGSPEAKNVPQYLAVPASQTLKQVFKPEQGARSLPNLANEMLLVTAAPTPAIGATAGTKLVEILCHVDRMYVRIRREVFKTRDAYKYLKLGTCPVNKGTKEHYYLEYLLRTDCGFEKKSHPDYLSFSNVLHYRPTGPVLREMPFDIPLNCNYPRFFHSYKVGFYPDRMGAVFKRLQPKTSFTLTPQDASGNEITGTKTFTLGEPMYFEATQPDRTAQLGGQRIYIDKCFVTASRDPNSNPRYTVIDNQGCMIDGKENEQSRFLAGASEMVQKFSLGALIFKNGVSASSSQQLYMHCEISVGTRTPTQGSKACNYDPATKTWKELYSDDSVCTCCDSTCSLAQPKASRGMISSHSWEVVASGKDDYAAVDPRMNSLDTFSFVDPDVAEHEDLKRWENDY